ncbi:MAG: hypothetical protein ACHREM_01185 [Polyangiales bacterium]
MAKKTGSYLALSDGEFKARLIAAIVERYSGRGGFTERAAKEVVRRQSGLYHELRQSGIMSPEACAGSFVLDRLGDITRDAREAIAGKHHLEASRLHHIAEKTDTWEAHHRAEQAHIEASAKLWDVVLHTRHEPTAKKNRTLAELHGKASAHHKARKEQITSAKWKAGRETFARTRAMRPGGPPPGEINVLDQHGGFTAETTKGNTLWRPASLLKHGETGTLVKVNPKSFYQTNNDVTMATYRVPGYRYPVVLWFDNKTGHRIA